MNTAVVAALAVDQLYEREWLVGVLIQTLSVAGFALGIVLMIWVGVRSGVRPQPARRQKRGRRR